MNVVRPTISWATAASMRSSVAGSTRAVASSSTTRSGWRSHTRARASSCASPGRQPGTRRRRAGGRCRRRPATPSPTVAQRGDSTASSLGAGSNSVTLSRIVPSNSSTSWGTRATRRRSSAIGMSRDAARRRAAPCPWSARRGAARSRENVVLPLPVRPTTPDRAAAGDTRRSMSRAATGRGLVAVGERRRARHDTASGPGGGDVGAVRRRPSARRASRSTTRPSPRWPSAPSPAAGPGPRADGSSAGRTGTARRPCRG